MEFQTYLSDCCCTNKGIIIYEGKPVCRWCRTPYAHGGEIRYDPEHFKKESKPIQDKDFEIVSFKSTIKDNYYWSLQPDGKYFNSDDCFGWSYERLVGIGYEGSNFHTVKNGQIAIQSVRLIIDNELYQKGELVGNILNNTKFYIEEIDVSTGECYFKAIGYLLPLRNAKKIKPKVPLQDYEIVRYGTKEFNLEAASLIESEKKKSCIFSVKRLSDNEIFYLGDKVFWYPKMNCDITTITEFRLMEDKSLNVYGEGFGIHFDLIKKVTYQTKPKVPLFTCDGVDIFDQDDYWWVNTSNFGYAKSKAFKNCLFGDKDTVIYFSTEEKAKEYILNNKPIQVAYIDICFMPQEQLLEYFKSKINS